MSISLINISFKYKEKTNTYDGFVLNKINVDFVKNINFVIGKSGCGKTTLINLILGLIKPNNGKILIDNTSSEVYSNYKIFEKIFYHPSEGICIENLTVKDNFCEIKNIKELNYLINIFNLNKLLDLNISKLSKGEQKKVSLIKAILCEQKYIIMDEPTSNLDNDSSSLFYSMLNRYKDNHVFLIFTHEMPIINYDYFCYNLNQEKLNEKQ